MIKTITKLLILLEADLGIHFSHKDPDKPNPMFDEEAMKLRIFRFKPGSPAPDLGIEPIDLSSAGSTLAKKKFTINGGKR